MEVESVKKPRKVSKKEAENMSVMEEKKKAFLLSDEQFEKLAEMVVRKIKPEVIVSEPLKGEGEVIRVPAAVDPPKEVRVEPEPVKKPKPVEPVFIDPKYGIKPMPIIHKGMPELPSKPHYVEEVKSKYGRK